MLCNYQRNGEEGEVEVEEERIDNKREGGRQTSCIEPRGQRKRKGERRGEAIGNSLKTHTARPGERTMTHQSSSHPFVCCLHLFVSVWLPVAAHIK